LFDVEIQRQEALARRLAEEAKLDREWAVHDKMMGY